VLAVLIVTVASGVAGWRMLRVTQAGRRPLVESMRRLTPVILNSEALFLLAFGGWAVVRPLGPRGKPHRATDGLASALGDLDELLISAAGPLARRIRDQLLLLWLLVIGDHRAPGHRQRSRTIRARRASSACCSPLASASVSTWLRWHGERAPRPDVGERRCWAASSPRCPLRSSATFKVCSMPCGSGGTGCVIRTGRSS
jgi:hypothetical protein